jgi:hypothetical protein
VLPILLERYKQLEEQQEIGKVLGEKSGILMNAEVSKPRQ